MSIHDSIQKQLDNFGFVDTEINPDAANNNFAPSSGRNEHEWYNNQLYTGGDRRLRLEEYIAMTEMAEISSGLDIYASDATQKDDEGLIVKIHSESQEIKEELEKLFYKNWCIDTHIWQITRGLCMYGDFFAEIIMNKDEDSVLYVKSLPPKTMWRIEQNGRLRGFVQDLPMGAPVHFAPFQMVHWRLPGNVQQYSPYGQSILESSRRTWRQLKLMEDAMVVTRITKAPMRRVFNIDVGTLPTQAAEAFVEKVRMKFRKRSFVDRNGQIDWRSNVMPPDEDFFLPKRQGTEGTSIQNLDGMQNINEIDDVRYFKDKIFAALKIPRIFLQDVEGQSERRQNVSQQDIMFSRTVERIQTHIIEGLKKVAIVHLMLRGYPEEALESFDISMSPPSDLAERMSLELHTERIQVGNGMVEFGFPRYVIAERLFSQNRKEWDQFRKDRFEEKKEEKAVENWSPEEEPQAGELSALAQEDDQVVADEDYTDDIDAIDLSTGNQDSNILTFTEKKKPYVNHYGKLLYEGELDREADAEYITEQHQQLLTEQESTKQKNTEQ